MRPIVLEITFGGLCMFVQQSREDHESPSGPPKGLYVLMPHFGHRPQPSPGEAQRRPAEHDEDHTPFLVCAAKYSADNMAKQKPIRGFAEDLRWLARHKTKQEFPPQIGRPSRYAGRKGAGGRWQPKPVDPYWLTTTKWDECLAARVLLPLGSSPITPVGDRADVYVRYGDPEQEHDEKMVGLASVQVTLDDPNQKSVPMFGVDLVPDRTSGVVRVGLVNVRPGDLIWTPDEPVMKDAEGTHFQAYYWLLQKSCKPPVGGPPIKARGPGPQEAGFIDPYVCTVGGGCMPGESDC